jgi:hypothetical protein
MHHKLDWKHYFVCVWEFHQEGYISRLQYIQCVHDTFFVFLGNNINCNVCVDQVG